MATSTCPICRHPVPTNPAGPDHPFCSARCKVVDLAKWLSGDYRVPVMDDDGEEPVTRTGDPLH
jgi:endogenous inhibitor of DNA gyrase (YacG/DUF329 family)